ncbi:MAG: D-amino-acid transaminase [Firmicutes bacterium]|jgi:D-alanine transaminase|nr:D-amino-acid transaminase [Bacillota bacterium]MDH7495682.1 D-amino-acid transaminase [Bacillota bacterium]
MPEIAYVNGEFIALSEARVSVEDRGFQFGDGVYEVVRCYRGKPFALDEHLARLERSAAGIELALPWTRHELRELAAEALQRSGIAEAVLYIQVTRGWAARNHAFPETVKPTIVLTVRPAKPVPPDRVERGASAITVPDERWLRCDIKSIDLLPNVMAKEKARRAGALEAVMIRDGAYVTEGSSSNVFAVIDGTIHTAPEGPRILSGVTRSIVLRLAREMGMRVVEDFFAPGLLADADEVFITSTTLEVTPCVQIDGRPVAAGRPGEITRSLAAAYASEVTARIGEEPASR